MIKKVILLCIAVLLALSCDLILQSGSNSSEKKESVLTSRVASLPQIEVDNLPEDSRAIGDITVLDKEQRNDGLISYNSVGFMEVDCYNYIIDLAAQYSENGDELKKGDEYIHQNCSFYVEEDGEQIVFLLRLLGSDSFCRIDVVEEAEEVVVDFRVLVKAEYGSFKYLTKYHASDEIIDRYIYSDVEGAPSIIITRDYIGEDETVHFNKVSGVFDFYELKYNDGTISGELSFRELAEYSDTYLGDQYSYTYYIEGDVVSNRTYNREWELISEEQALKYVMPLTEEYIESYSVVTHQELYNWSSFYLNYIPNDLENEVVIDDDVDIFFDTFKMSETFNIDSSLGDVMDYYLVDAGLPYFSYSYTSDINDNVDLISNRFMDDFDSFIETEFPQDLIENISMDLFKDIN